MRVDFSKALDSVLARNPRALFVTGDLGFKAFENVQAAYGKRFLNAGVAEQHMVGAAAGMAFSGQQPWVYSITPFLVFRALEQIRDDVCLHNLPVRLVGNGGGFTYGINGSTHHALEDLGVLKGLPNLTLFFPCANDHVAAAVEAMDQLASPSYLRLSISGFAAQAKPLRENPKTLTRKYRAGKRLTIVGVGHASQIVMQALEKTPLDVDFFGVARFPFDLESDRELVESAKRTGRVLAVDEHYLAGSIAESFGVALPKLEAYEILAPHYFNGQKYGSPQFHLKQAGVTPDEVVRRAQALMG